MIKSRRERYIILIIISVVIFSIFFQPIVQDYGRYILLIQKDISLRDSGYELDYKLKPGHLFNRVLAITGIGLLILPFNDGKIFSENFIEPWFLIFLKILPWAPIPIMIKLTQNIENLSTKRRFFYIWIVSTQLVMYPSLGWPGMLLILDVLI